MIKPSAIEAAVQSANSFKMKMVIVAAPNRLRHFHDYTLDLTLRLLFVAHSPTKARGQQNGADHLFSGTCADLLKAKDGAVCMLANGLQGVTDQQEMFGRDFLAGPPIDDGRRSYAGHAGCFGRSTEGVYDIIN
jgi:hypothetical protein